MFRLRKSIKCDLSKKKKTANEILKENNDFPGVQNYFYLCGNVCFVKMS